MNVGETISARTCLNDAEIVENSRFGARFVNQVERTEFLSSDTGEIVAENFMTIRRFERSEVTKKSKYSERILASYTREESEKISEAYGNERPRGSVPRPVSSVRVDEAMGAMLKGPLSVSNIIAYLAGAGTSFIFANREHYRFLSDNPTAALLHPDNGILESVEAPHWDSELAKAFSGLPAGYDLGAQRVCWFSHYVTDWMGDSGFLKDLQVKLLKPNLLGDLTTMNGKVAAIDRVAKQVKLEMTATNQLSEVTAIATAIVDLSRWG
ncbi:hypothetical protein HPO_19143 [Hyphomonas polymorpha PS728]|uniref:Uncharacterized protein n=1 Tax=Hyphomonas polymorpha PS728 TaxID=1280954 RepID=A0A062VDN8_9PROT|nr:hypothetical protein HPO_19143 [Hyphomonas polymorpha PS728]